MKPLPRPLLFLGAVLGLWTATRVAVLMPDAGLAGRGKVGPVAVRGPSLEPVGVAAVPAAAGGASIVQASDLRHLSSWVRPARSLPMVVPARGAPLQVPAVLWSSPEPVRQTPALTVPGASAAAVRELPIPHLRPARQTSGRLAGSAWVLLREEAGDPAFAPGGTLGGSQAGMRLTYRLNGDERRPIALSARTYVPVERPRGAEAAVGLDWRPVPAVPINLLVERRVALGKEGRSDFAAVLYGGIDRPVAGGRLRVEAYGQAGIVGVEERDLFADGSARITTRVGPVQVGAGAWGGAQPGAARLDIGPHLSVGVPVGRASVRLAAEWRFRVAGDAAPGSGPALTLATDF